VVAQARTVTVLRGMDAMHKRDVLHFLHSASLIDTSGKVVSLSHAPLSRVDLSEGYLPAADLSNAVLREANLNLADLSNANLSNANLQGVGLSDEQIAAAESLEGATMPIGQKYEDWLGTPEGQEWFNTYKKGRQ